MNLLYNSYYFASYQCDRSRSFYIDFGHKQVKLSFCQLLALRQKVLSIDISTHFDKNQNYNGIEIISLCNREHLFVFDTLQILDLKELLTATFGVFELNSLVAH
ncbi:hypothetical protein [Salinimicrobium oceani]|uniref:Uncharacterized protein n=1 Tax=Salinimicrobium oceani TaxID=2722702 RepID=A0ABX1CYJ8_9FLAO|nr:hypothetical protein [Salinimicrobium oceani]NJW53010.1 hypothetical protein [Salinimicrobium oceani]